MLTCHISIADSIFRSQQHLLSSDSYQPTSNNSTKYNRKQKMSRVDLVFSNTLTPCDPEKHPVLIVGQVKNLLQLGYERIKVKLQPRVSKEVRCTQTPNFNHESSNK